MINEKTKDKFVSENYKHSDLTELVIKEVYYVHNKLGFGFMEKVYENALLLRLKKIGLDVKNQFPIKVSFDGVIIGDDIADIIVNNLLIVEIKSVKTLKEIHEVQLVNYLKATGIELGLLINFGAKVDIRRRVLSNRINNVEDSDTDLV